MAIFAENALQYYENDLVVIPVRGKAPAINEWPKWCQERPSREELTAWLNEHGKCGVSLMCGPVNGICGFDIDTDDEEILNIIKKTLPRSPVAKKGRRGFTAFYRFNFGSLAAETSKSSLTLEAKGRSVVDVLLAKHTVLPPSVHPDNGKPYEWLTHDTLIDFDIDDLPELTLADIEELQGEFGKLIGKSDGVVSGVRHGRNDYLKAVLSRLIAARTPTDEAISILIKEDELYSPSNPLFAERKENAGCDHVWANAVRFYSSNYHSFAKRNRKSGDKVEMPYTAMVNLRKFSEKFPNMDTGFFYLDEKGRKLPDYYGFSDYFIAKHKLYSTDGYRYVFDQSHYRMMGDTEFGNLISKYTKRQIKALSHFNMFSRTTDVSGFGRDKVLEPTEGLINLKNGIYHLEKKELLPHDPRYGFHYCLDYKFDASAQCPMFLDFLEDIFNGDKDTIELVQQFMAYTLIGGAPFLHRALCFTGSGRNGKSTLIDVIRALLGGHNVSSVSLNKIDDHFQAVNLDGKLANLVEELPIDVISSEAFKSIIAGGEIAMSKKFKDIYHKPVNARFIFATNDMPVFKDTSAGLYERIVFVDFPKYIPEEARIANLNRKLIGEISGIFNWAIECLPFRQNFKLKVPKASKRLKEEFLEESNSVIFWFKDRTIVNKNMESFVPYQNLFEDYRPWVQAKGMRAVSYISFCKRLKKYIELNVDGVIPGRTDWNRGLKGLQLKDRFLRFG